MSIDTCSLISMIESNNLRTNRIMKFGKKLKVNHLYKENNMSKDGSVEDNMIIDDKMEHDLRTITNRTKNIRGITDEITDRKMNHLMTT